MAQALHAFREFISEHKDLELEWYNNSNYIAILSAKNEDELIKLTVVVGKKELKFSIFRELDFNNEITAVVIEPKGRKITSNFPLAMKNCGLIK